MAGCDRGGDGLLGCLSDRPGVWRSGQTAQTLDPLFPETFRLDRRRDDRIPRPSAGSGSSAITSTTATPRPISHDPGPVRVICLGERPEWSEDRHQRNPPVPALGRGPRQRGPVHRRQQPTPASSKLELSRLHRRRQRGRFTSIWSSPSTAKAEAARSRSDPVSGSGGQIRGRRRRRACSPSTGHSPAILPIVPRHTALSLMELIRNFDHRPHRPWQVGPPTASSN